MKAEEQGARRRVQQTRESGSTDNRRRSAVLVKESTAWPAATGGLARIIHGKLDSNRNLFAPGKSTD
jgi:hypothetical protein